MSAPAALVGGSRGVVDEDALVADDVQLVGHFVELKAPFVEDEVCPLIVLGHRLADVVQVGPHSGGGRCSKSHTNLPSRVNFRMLS